MKHLDTMSGPIYTETERDLFYEDLVSTLQIYNSLCEKQAKSVRSKLQKVFESLALKSEQAFENATTHAVNIVIALGRQAAGSSAALDVIARTKEAQEACKDQAVRHHFDMDLFRRLLQDSSLDETVPQDVADVGHLKAKCDAFERLMIFVNYLPDFCATLAEFMTKKSDEAMQLLTQSMLRLKSGAEATVAIEELRPHVTHLEEVCGVRDSAMATYVAALADFKWSACVLVEAGLEAFYRAGAVVGGVRDLRESVNYIGALVFTLKQQAAFSDTPNHDREAIDLAHQVLPICCHAGLVQGLKTKVPDGFLLGAEVVEGISALLADLESSKPKVQWLLGVELANKFLSLAKDMSATLDPIKEKDSGSAMDIASKAVKNLRSLLADDSAMVSDDSFFAMFSAAKMEKIRRVRADAKAAVIEARQRHLVCGIPLPEELISWEALLGTARRQTVKYGFLALTRSPDAKTNTDTGKVVRKTLKHVWDTHCTNDDMVAYLGTSLVESVKASLAYDASEPVCSGQQPAGGGRQPAGNGKQGKQPCSKRSKASAAAAAAEATAEQAPAKKRSRYP